MKMTDVDSGSIDVIDSSFWLEHLPRLREREGHLAQDEVEQVTSLCTRWIPELERICTHANASEFDLELTILLHAVDAVAPQADQDFLIRMLDSEIWHFDDLTSFKAWLFSIMISDRSDQIFDHIMKFVQVADAVHMPPLTRALNSIGSTVVYSWLFATISTAYGKPCRFPISPETLERHRSVASSIKDLNGFSLLAESY